MTRINTQTLREVANHPALTGKPAWARLVEASAKELDWHHQDIAQRERDDEFEAHREKCTGCDWCDRECEDES